LIILDCDTHDDVYVYFPGQRNTPNTNRKRKYEQDVSLEAHHDGPSKKKREKLPLIDVMHKRARNDVSLCGCIVVIAPK
jgi:hypothetical protein